MFWDFLSYVQAIGIWAWAGFGFVEGALTLYKRWSGRDIPTRAIQLGILVLFLVVAPFLAWRDEHQQVQAFELAEQSEFCEFLDKRIGYGPEIHEAYEADHKTGSDWFSRWSNDTVAELGQIDADKKQRFLPENKLPPHSAQDLETALERLRIFRNEENCR